MRVAPMVNADEILLPERAEDGDESFEEFDRVEFAREALELVRPHDMTIAICPGASRLHVEAGRSWGQGRRWAMVRIPPWASKRSITLALATLANAGEGRPYQFDVLFARASG